MVSRDLAKDVIRQVTEKSGLGKNPDYGDFDHPGKGVLRGQ